MWRLGGLRSQDHQGYKFIKRDSVYYYKVGHLNTVDPCVPMVYLSSPIINKKKVVFISKWAHNQGQESRYKQMYRFLC